tara:strand:- start:631 stop:1452 length:822 start_codon:yes stop_codon:yes gene_type:complete
MFKYDIYRKPSDSASGGYKVWGYSIQSDDLVVVWGSAIGSKQFKRWSFGSPAEARRAAVDRSSKKVREGYEEVQAVYVEGNDFPSFDSKGWPESHTSLPEEVVIDPKVGAIKSTNRVIHWNVLPKGSKRSNKKESRLLLVKAKMLLDRVIHQSKLPGAVFDARSAQVGSWSIDLEGEQTFIGGSLKTEEGVDPLLVLLAWKKAVDASGESVTLSICDDESQPLDMNIRKLSAQLAIYGEDIESVRDRAELLGLLLPKLKITVANDCEFDDFSL